MKTNMQITKILGLAILLILTPLACLAGSPVSDGWKVIGPGGGGTMIAPTISPHDSKLVVEHCDMTGGYVTRDNGESWRMFNLRGGINVLAFDPAAPSGSMPGMQPSGSSNDFGRTWKMVFPSPARNTVEHQLGDHSDYSLTSNDPAYPGGEITAIAIASQGGAKNGEGSAKHFYLSFGERGRTTVIISSMDGGITWTRLATVPQRVLLLAPQNSGLIAVSGSSAWRIANDGSTTNWASSQPPFEQPARRSPATRSGSTQPAETEKFISPRIPART